MSTTNKSKELITSEHSALPNDEDDNKKESKVKNDDNTTEQEEEEETMYRGDPPQDFAIVKHATMPSSSSSSSSSSPSLSNPSIQELEQRLKEWIDKDTIQRLELSPTNLTVPVALRLLLPKDYPSASRARKACRKGNVVVCRRNPNHKKDTKDTLEKEQSSLSLSSSSSSSSLVFRKAKVVDRIYSHDILGIQTRMSHGSYSKYICQTAKPTFDVPVLYEDDHFAIVNKPAGIEVYQDGGVGRTNVRFALPYVLQPPPSNATITFGNKKGQPTNDSSSSSQSSSTTTTTTMIIPGILKRPEICHRLDKPTTGILVVAKTKPSSMVIAHQFLNRKVYKTYTAIVYGKPHENLHLASSTTTTSSSSSVEPSRKRSCQAFTKCLSTKEAQEMGFDIQISTAETTIPSTVPTENGIQNLHHLDQWYLAQNFMDDKEGTTLWRPLQVYPLVRDGNKDQDENSSKSKSNDDGDNDGDNDDDNDDEYDAVTVVELFPKTGRYHQLRRQMAWMYQCPIVGDNTYGGRNTNYKSKISTDEKSKCSKDEQHGEEREAKEDEGINPNPIMKKVPDRWQRGLMLCSNRLTIPHPFYNSNQNGTAVWKQHSKEIIEHFVHEQQESKSKKEKESTSKSSSNKKSNNYINTKANLYETTNLDKFQDIDDNRDGRNCTVLVSVEIDLPYKYKKFLKGQVRRLKHSTTTRKK